MNLNDIDLDGSVASSHRACGVTTTPSYIKVCDIDLSMAPVAMAARLPAWGKPNIGKPKRDKARAKMARESRRRNRGR